MGSKRKNIDPELMEVDGIDSDQLDYIALSDDDEEEVEAKESGESEYENDDIYEDAYDPEDSHYEDSSVDEDALDDIEEFRQNLAGASNMNIKAKRRQFKKYAMSSKATDPEIRDGLSRANEAYVAQNYDEAGELYLKVLAVDPGNTSALRSIAEIALEKQDRMEGLRLSLQAASIAKTEEILWVRLAELASSLGFDSLAIKGYSKAIALKGKLRFKYIKDRSMLYKKNKIYGRALDGFRKLHQRFPLNHEYIRELASIYVEQNRTNDAINLYLDILDRNIHRKDRAQRIPRFDWNELNILCELYINRHEWLPALKVIKIASRYIQGRSDEAKIWDEIDNDAEFDTRRLNYLQNHKRLKKEMLSREYEFPFIDIRFKLGVVRLELGDHDEASIHFKHLLEEDDIPDLLFEAGKALENNGYYSDALLYLIKAAEDDTLGQDVDLITSIAKCYFETQSFEDARDLYEEILRSTPNDNNIKLLLAEVLYYNDDKERSKQLLDEVARSTKKVVRVTDNIGGDDTVIAGRDSGTSGRRTKLTDQQAEETDERVKRKVLDTFKRMNRLEDVIAQGDEVAIDTWMQLASQLIEIFTSVPSFFPRDKNRIFKGIVLYRRKKPLEIDERLARVYNLYEGMNTTETNSRSVLTSEKEFKGVDYDSWFMIFVQYALFLKYKNNTEYGAKIIEIATDVSVFVQDKAKESMLKLILIMFGIANEEYLDTVSRHVRSFLLNNQFSPFIYKFFLCCFASGSKAWDVFSNYNHQKFFLRQLKAYDSVKSKEPVSGMATITADKSFTYTHEPIELLYIYANLLGGSRSHISSVVYLNRIYKEYDQDPMICFSLGISHVQRSMQRLSSNRHVQLLQGLSYLMEYRELRLKGSEAIEQESTSDPRNYEKQEVEYNLGRVFHMIGLTTEAVSHYEKVLELEVDDEDYDLRIDAAYNLSLIYNINGNSGKARELTEKYLTV